MELVDLQRQIASAVADDPVATYVRDVSVEADSDEFGSEFLRVYVDLKPHERDLIDQLSALISRIEDAVADIDDRYPSVRFTGSA